MPRSFLEVIQERPVLFDGGIGTEIYARGVFLNRCYEELNLTRPGLVQEVHRSFLLAGAEAIETNTFGASRPRLEPHGLGERVRELNLEAARITRAEVGERAFVAGAVGPLGIRLEPWGPTSVDEAVGLFREQMLGLVEGGVDLLVLETFSDLVEIQAAVRAAKQTAPLPIVAMMTVDENGRTPEGVPPEWMTQKLEATGAHVIGINCSVGPAPMLSVLELMNGMTHTPLAAMPNAGIPRQVEGRLLYVTSPAYMGRYASRFASAGARVVGGCCGVTPEHVRAMRQALSQTPAEEVFPRVVVEPPRAAPREPVAKEEKSTLAAKAESGRWLTLFELSPPRGWETQKLLDGVTPLLEAGLDGLLIPDDPRALSRMSSLALARLVLDGPCAGSGAQVCEPVLSYSCRDRRLLGLQADLLGAHALGLRNLLPFTGQEPRPGEASWSSGSFDVDGIGLTNVAFRLNHGLDVGDNPIGEPTAFFIGATLAAAPPMPDEEVRRFEWKVDAGAEYAVTTPIFDESVLESILEQIASVRVPVIATVRPPRSLRELESLAQEMPGVRVPEGLLSRFSETEDQADQRRLGIEIARGIAERVRPMVEGIVISGLELSSEEGLEIAGEWIGSDVPESRPFPGRPGIKGGAEGQRYQG
jgi:homocysteine S-methyltransferase